jgi:hypothetical protein
MAAPRIPRLRQLMAGVVAFLGWTGGPAQAQTTFSSYREPAETTNQVTVTLASARNPVQTNIVAQGTGAFQLCNPNWTDEQIVLNPTIVPTAATKLFFESRQTLATTTQVAKVEGSTNGGVSWALLWSQAGTWSSTNASSTGDALFKLVTIPLATYANIPLKIRFLYDFTGDLAFTNTGAGFGWYIDNLQIGPFFEKRLVMTVGEPTANEILMVEYINRARKDTAAESARLRYTTDTNVQNAIAAFSVNLPLMQAQFAALSNNLPPLAINAKLTAAARLHSQDMLLNAFQNHTSSITPVLPNLPLDTITNRLNRQNYPYAWAGENVYAFAKDAWFAHAGLNIDWGYGTGGMQVPAGHRLAIHSPTYNEIGVGVVLGSNTIGATTVGPFIVTQDFGVVQGDPFPTVTGVVINDTNGDRFYNSGEGLGGVRIECDPGSTYTVSSTSGAYSLPLATNGTYKVTFRPRNSDPIEKTITVTNFRNTKVDYLGERARIQAVERGASNIVSFTMNTSGSPNFQVVRSGDLLNWTNTPHVATNIGSGLTKVTPSGSSNGISVFYKIQTIWTNL